MDNKPSFLSNHADTLAIIGVNIGIAAMLLTLILLNSSRIDATHCRLDAMNARSDALYTIVYDMLKEGRK